MTQNTLLKVLEQLLHKIKANRRREMGRTHLQGLMRYAGHFPIVSSDQPKIAEIIRVLPTIENFRKWSQVSNKDNLRTSGVVENTRIFANAVFFLPSVAGNYSKLQYVVSVPHHGWSHETVPSTRYFRTSEADKAFSGENTRIFWNAFL